MNDPGLFSSSASEGKTLILHLSDSDLDSPIHVSVYFLLFSWFNKGIISVSELEVFLEGGFSASHQRGNAFYSILGRWLASLCMNTSRDRRWKRTGGGLFHVEGSSDD